MRKLKFADAQTTKIPRFRHVFKGPVSPRGVSSNLLMALEMLLALCVFALLYALDMYSSCFHLSTMTPTRWDASAVYPWDVQVSFFDAFSYHLRCSTVCSCCCKLHRRSINSIMSLAAYMADKNSNLVACIFDFERHSVCPTCSVLSAFVWVHTFSFLFFSYFCLFFLCSLFPLSLFF